MKVGKKDVLLLLIITIFLFTIAAFTFREGVDRGEWITPGDPNKDRYYNEHKTSGNPEIDAIRYNHRAKKPQYIDSNLNPTIYQLDPLPLTLPKPTEPIKQLTPEAWSDGIRKLNNPETPEQYSGVSRRLNTTTPKFNVSSSSPIQDRNKVLIRKRRKRDS
jgi:hypothetical protein